MKDLELSPRLRAISALVPFGARLADIGTDHAYLPASLLLTGRIDYAIASDINMGPLQRGKETAKKYELEHKLFFRYGNGLQSIEPSDRIDTIVIAGMGGELIAGILRDSPLSRHALLLLQPMTAQPALRTWLNRNNYTIHREILVREGDKLYVILAVRDGMDSPYSQAEIWAGRQKRDSAQPLRLEYLNDLIRRRELAMGGMTCSVSVPAVRLQEEENLIKQLQAMREEWITWQQ